MNSFLQLVNSIPTSDAYKQQFIDRINQGTLTRDEGRMDHLCVYFAAYDPHAHEVFVGHHIKSGLWLFNGGHIDRGELPQQAVLREIGEEWGIETPDIPAPAMLSIVDINRQSMPCTRHYDIWHFIPVDKQTFAPDPALLAAEYHQIGWYPIPKIRARVTDQVTHTALDHIESTLFL